MNKITDYIYNVGSSSYDVDLFEGQYIVPNGMAYNSYLVLDEKNVLFDGVDSSLKEEWEKNVETVLSGKSLDYLVVSHVEPDHSSSITAIMDKYPNLTIVLNAKAIALIKQFYGVDYTNRAIIVKDGDTLTCGSHEFKFVFAPMVHWPEVMMTYELTEKVLFSADAFGKFGAYDYKEDWACEARRYYFNIVGKYGVQVQAVLKKLANFKINIILGLHGPSLTENIEYYLNLYDIWSSYSVEVDGVFIAYASIYGNTKKAAYLLKDKLEKLGVRVAISDLARSDIAENVEDAFKYGKLVLASPTTDMDVFPVMKEFISHIVSKNYQNRKVGFIENGSWAAQSGKIMKEMLEKCKNIDFCTTTVSIKSALSEKNDAELDFLASELV